MYAEVSVVVDGALEDEEVFHDYLLMDQFVSSVRGEALGHGYPTEVYVVEHEHGFNIDCECSQYVLDHTPQFSFNMEGVV